MSADLAEKQKNFKQAHKDAKILILNIFKKNRRRIR